MTPLTIATYGFPGVLNEIIARSAMKLPPLTSNLQMEFLRVIGETVQMVFWTNYLMHLSEDEQKEVMGLIGSDDTATAAVWLTRNCDLLHDATARARADRVLADIEGRLPSVMEREYNSFVQTHTHDASDEPQK